MTPRRVTPQRPDAAHRCESLIEQLSTYVDGELDGASRRALLAHLKRCPCCQALADGLRDTHDACRRAGAARLPAEVRERARERVALLLASSEPARAGRRVR